MSIHKITPFLSDIKDFFKNSDMTAAMQSIISILAQVRMTERKWLDKTTAAEEKRRAREQLIRAKAKEADFLKSKSCYFGIVISDKDIEVSVLDSIEAYQAEETAMHHCVFKCEYYAQKDFIVLSAHDKSGNRIETVEYSLTENKVVQSRGVCNTNTEYHDRIISLVNANAHRFIEARASA